MIDDLIQRLRDYQERLKTRLAASIAREDAYKAEVVKLSGELAEKDTLVRSYAAELELVREELAAIKAQPAQEPAPDPNCPRCGGTGAADSGGILPWGEPALIKCECLYPDPQPIWRKP